MSLSWDIQLPNYNGAPWCSVCIVMCMSTYRAEWGWTLMLSFAPTLAAARNFNAFQFRTVIWNVPLWVFLRSREAASSIKRSQLVKYIYETPSVKNTLYSRHFAQIKRLPDHTGFCVKKLFHYVSYSFEWEIRTVLHSELCCGFFSTVDLKSAMQESHMSLLWRGTWVDLETQIRPVKKGG